MAKRRMFSLEIVDTDHFMDMPASAQLLYYHLGMRADDDGFMASPRTMARCIGAREADLQLLADQGYIVLFDSGVCWIRDWTTNNRIRRDCYTPTRYQKEKNSLSDGADEAEEASCTTAAPAAAGGDALDAAPDFTEPVFDAAHNDTDTARDVTNDVADTARDVTNCVTDTVRDVTYIVGYHVTGPSRNRNTGKVRSGKVRSGKDSSGEVRKENEGADGPPHAHAQNPCLFDRGTGSLPQPPAAFEAALPSPGGEGAPVRTLGRMRWNFPSLSNSVQVAALTPHPSRPLRGTGRATFPSRGRRHDSLRPWSQSQIAPRFGCKRAGGMFASRVAPSMREYGLPHPPEV